MKISLEFKDLLLERTLELFLKEHLVMKKDCDFIISDTKIPNSKPFFIIAKNSPFLFTPFSKKKLLAGLEESDTALELATQKHVEEEKRKLEAKVDHIANEFRKDYQDKIDMAILELKNKLVKALVNE